MKKPGVDDAIFSRRLLDGAILFLATGAYLSYIPGWVLMKLNGVHKRGGEGFIGSVEGFFLFFLMPKNPRNFLFLFFAFALASFWICGRSEIILGRHDDGRIILDEILGMMIAAFLLPHAFKFLASAFVFFRLFDALKVFPVNWCEKFPGGFGVVADDICAGVMANLAARLIF